MWLTSVGCQVANLKKEPIFSTTLIRTNHHNPAICSPVFLSPSLSLSLSSTLPSYTLFKFYGVIPLIISFLSSAPSPSPSSLLSHVLFQSCGENSSNYLPFFILSTTPSISPVHVAQRLPSYEMMIKRIYASSKMCVSRAHH